MLSSAERNEEELINELRRGKKLMRRNYVKINSYLVYLKIRVLCTVVEQTFASN
jgi:hypothetical protein